MIDAEGRVTGAGAGTLMMTNDQHRYFHAILCLMTTNLHSSVICHSCTVNMVASAVQKVRIGNME